MYRYSLFAFLLILLQTLFFFFPTFAQGWTQDISIQSLHEVFLSVHPIYVERYAQPWFYLRLLDHHGHTQSFHCRPVNETAWRVIYLPYATYHYMRLIA
jgi:hypothetical protein